MNTEQALSKAWREWIALWHLLKKEGFPNLAGILMSVPPRGTPDSQVHRILYVGKATARDWHANKITEQTSAEECIDWARDFLAADAVNTPFWSFGDRLEGLFKTKTDGHRLYDHVIWTNLYKIGVTKGNPGGRLASRQRALAIETLKLEIEVYRPSLIVFVVAHYGMPVIEGVVGDLSKDAWQTDLEEHGIWWREAKDGLPPILWTYHPERKPRERRDIWISKVGEMLQGLR